MWRFLVYYLVLSGFGLTLLQASMLDSWVNSFCWGLAQASGHLAQLFDSSIILQGDIIRESGSQFALQITEACSGLSVTWLLLSAVMVFPAPWQHRVIGVVAGFVLVQSLNIIRIVSLLYLGAWERSWFDPIHEQLWPLLLHVAVLVLFLLWLNISFKKQSPNEPAVAS
jgi:exosortase H (IPTLxxWG-CTERM-specific)